MSRVSPALHSTILLLSSAAVLCAASPAFAQAELRRLPISFDLPALKAPAHRLSLHKVHHKSHKRTAPAEEEGEAFVRAANLLMANGYANFTNLRAEGDHVAADVARDSGTQHVIVTAQGEIAHSDVAVTDSAGLSGAPEPDVTPVLTPMPVAQSRQIASPLEVTAQAVATAGSTSDAASPGALSASSNTP